MASIITSTSFTNSVLAQNSVTVTRTPITKVLLTNGDEELVEGSTEEISVVFSEKITQYTQEKHGLQKGIDAFMMVGPSQSLAKDDKITHSGNNYRIVNVRTRGPSGSTAFYKYAELVLI